MKETGEFLREVASLFSKPEKFGCDGCKKEDFLSRFTFIFPNRRSSLFFKKYLGEACNMPVFSPQIITVNDLFLDLSGLNTADHLTLMSELCKCFNKVKSEAAIKNGLVPEEEKLDDFIFWGGIILSDFQDADQYLVDAKQLFANIEDLNDIKFDFSWMSEEQQKAAEKIAGIKNFWRGVSAGRNKEYNGKFLNIWSLLYPLYLTYRETLASKKLSYPAMQYRAVAEAVRTGTDDAVMSRVEKIDNAVFIGFSAPNNCEKTLMRYFSRRKNDDGKPSGYFYWDYFSQMIKARENKSSMLISRCVSEFPSSPKIDGCLEEKTVFASYSVPGNVPQTFVVSEILSEIAKKPGWDAYKDASKTAVIVSDEMLLLPMLTAVPDSYKDRYGRVCVNVTMGYPLAATSAASFSNLMAALHLSVRKKRGKENGKEILLLKGSVLLDFLNHPYVKCIDEGAVSKLRENILGSNLFFADADCLPGMTDNEELKVLLQKLVPSKEMEGEEDILKPILSWQLSIYDYISKFISKRERGFVYKYSIALSSLKRNDILISGKRSAYSIIRSAVGNLTVSFKGEPLRGLQIMGPLETRALDFDNVIYLSFNEGVYPASGEQKSCIPYSLRKYFGLPTYENNDSISAYNFYRMIQRAKNVYCIYNNVTEGVKVGEESRFLKQLKYGFGVKTEDKNISFKVSNSAIAPLSQIAKNAEDIKAIRNMTFSASALNLYIDCPLKFYFSRIMNVAAEDELSESVDGGTFGTIFHECMKKIYTRGSKGEFVVNKGFISSLIANCMKDNYKFLNDIIAAAFDEVIKAKVMEGENLVISELVKKYIINALYADKERAEKNGDFRFIEAERGIEYTYKGSRFKAIFDRAEEHFDASRADDGVVRISDYKTGNFKSGDFKALMQEGADARFGLLEYDADSFGQELDSVFDSSGSRPKTYANLFQILLYASLYIDGIPIDSSKEKYIPDYIETAIYPLKSITNRGIVTFKITKEDIREFETRLERLLLEIKGAGENGACFRMCEKTDNCSYCDFKSVCNR